MDSSYYHRGDDESSHSSYDSAQEELPPDEWMQERMIGRGSFGIVSLWRNQNTRQNVVVKEFRSPHPSSFTLEEQRFIDEAQMIMRLSHKNIVKAIDLPSDAKLSQSIESLYLCMEYCDGGDLRQVLERSENFCGLPERDIRTMVADIACGLQFLHAKDITHRDIKPENILLKHEGHEIVYKLSDFGYAKEAESNKLVSLVGTLQYAAPEVLRVSERPYRRSVDCWSFGVVVFESCCGRRPFLHNHNWVTELSIIESKKSQDIFVYRPKPGTDETIYSDRLPQPNRLSRPLTDGLEKWLRMVLEVNSVRRNGTDSLNYLNGVIQTKVINIISMSTGCVSSYSAFKVESYQALHEAVRRDRALSSQGISGAYLLTTEGKKVEELHSPPMICQTGALGEVFLFCDDSPKTQLGSIHDSKIPPQYDKPSAKERHGEKLFHVLQQVETVRSLARGLKAAQKFVEKMRSDFSEVANMEEFLIELRVKCNLLKSSIDSDISELKDLTKECEFEASQLEIVQEVLKDWKRKQTELQDILQESRVSGLKEEIQSFSEIFNQMYQETKSNLETVRADVDHQMHYWSDPDQSLKKLQNLFKALKSAQMGRNEGLEASYNELIRKILSQCQAMATRLNSRNFYSDLYYLEVTLNQLRASYKNLLAIGKVLNEINGSKQKGIWSILRGFQQRKQKSHSAPNTSVESRVDFQSVARNVTQLITTTQPPGAIRMRTQPNTEPQYTFNTANKIPRRMRGNTISQSNIETDDVVISSLSMFSRTASLTRNTSLKTESVDGLKNRFSRLISSISQESEFEESESNA